MRAKGKISSWNDEKGFGFIEPFDGSKRTFIHIKAFVNKSRRPVQGDVVTYSLGKDNQGRPCAEMATLAGDRPPKTGAKPSNIIHIVSVTAFFTILVISALASKLMLVVPVVYVIASLITFFVYAFDKSAAKNDDRRVPENTLHLLSIIGGWPGAMLAQQKLRHKSKKVSFRVVYWMTVVINLGILGWIYTPTGSSMLKDIINNLY